MAAIQKIRSKGALLIGALGLALFAFIAEEFFRSIETTSAIERSQVGEAYGKKLSYQEYMELAEELDQVSKFQLMLNGKEPNLTGEQSEANREMVWEQFIQNTMIAHECEKLGLSVTDAEVQEALREGTAQSLQLMTPVFANQQTGEFDLAQLQQFLKEYDKALIQAQQSNNAEAVEQLQLLKDVWTYTEKQLRTELLASKFNLLFAMGFTSNPTVAKLHFDQRSTQKTALVAGIPYTSVDEKEITITDEELKAAYEPYKEKYYMPVPSRDIKYIDVAITASGADRSALMKEVRSYQALLEEGASVDSIVRVSNSLVPYTDLAMTKSAFRKYNDVFNAIETMEVGDVHPTSYTRSDNTISTFKLLSREQAPDSILFHQIVAIADTPEATKAQADSILTALQGGASFHDLALKYGQRSDSIWLTSKSYEAFGLNEQTCNYLSTLNSIPAGKAQVISNDQGAVVVEVLDRRAMVDKYKVAVVKCELKFSTKTYETELAKLNTFLAENKTLEQIEENAPKSGYTLVDRPGYSALSNTIPSEIGGSQARDCVRWIFDAAKAGEISRLYECGNSNDHLLVAAVASTNKVGSLPWDNATVKGFLSTLLLQEKKAEKLLAATKDVKGMSDFLQLEGAVSDTLSNQVFTGYSVLKGVNVAEPSLSAVLAKTEKGKTSAPIAGSAAVYVAKVIDSQTTPEEFDNDQEQSMLSQQMAQRSLREAYDYLTSIAGKIKDRRYEF